jgi:hypothetical protein
VNVIEPEPIAPTITTFTATPDTISEGATSTLEWEVTGDEPITLTIEPDLGDVTGLSSVVIEPIETTTYTLTATNNAGDVEASVDVTVIPVTTLTCTAEAWAGAWSTSYNQMTLSASGNTLIGNYNTSNHAISGEVQEVNGRCFLVGTWQWSTSNFNGTFTFELTSPTTFAGRWSSSAVITPDNLDNGGINWRGTKIGLNIVSFTATPEAINAGESSTLAWEVTGDEPITMTIEPDVGDVTGLSSVEVSPVETTTYTLTAENAVGSVNAETTVTVTPTGRECDGTRVSSQAQLETLRSCEIITGSLRVIRSNDIEDLEPLNSLLEVQGNLNIYDNSALISLVGLENLTSVGGRFALASIVSGGNDVLSSIDSLANLTTIRGDFYFIENNSLPSLSLPGLTSVGGGIYIARNSSITSIAFSSLTFVGRSITVGGGNALGANAATSIDFSNLTSLGSSLNIKDNLGLVSVDFGMLSAIPNNLFIVANDLLTQVDFGSLTSIVGDVNFGSGASDGNDSLASFAGLDNLTFIGGRLTIQGNDSLTTIEALANLQTVGDNISINRNDVLPSLAGIENIAGYDNDNLVSISENDNLDCTPPPALPFIVDTSSNNAIDCPTP